MQRVRQPKTFLRRVERVLVGAVMTVMAFLLERIVMRNVRKKGVPKPAAGATPIVTKGDVVDLDEK